MRTKLLDALLALWARLPEPTRQVLLDRWPWLLVAVAAVAVLAGCLCFCACCPPAASGAEAPAAASPPRGKTCPCSVRCQCGCNAGEPCRCASPAHSAAAARSSRSVIVVPSAPPTPAPAPTPPPAPLPEDPPTGVEHDKLDTSPTPRYRRRGLEISRDEAFRLLKEKSLVDDSGRLRLTVIGPDAARNPVLADLQSHPALTPLRDRYLLQAYAPDHWAVRDCGFVTTGSPTVYVQAPDGKVLHRQDDYRGPERLAEAIRKADPLYKPEKDPDLNKPRLIPSLPDLSKVPPLYWLAGGVGLYLLLAAPRTPPPAKKES